MICELTSQETNLLISVHQELDGNTDNLAVSYELLENEKNALETAREKEKTQSYFKAIVRKAKQKRKNEDHTKTGKAPLDIDESRFFGEAKHRERKAGAPPPASDMYFLSNILGWNAEEKYSCMDGGYRDIASKLWQEVEKKFSRKKKVYVECFRLHTGNPSYWDYNELSEEFGIEPGTIRAGVHRVKKELIRLIHQIENHTFAPPHRDIPNDIFEARQLFERKEFDEARQRLDAMADKYADNPFYYKALGDLSSEKKLDTKAVEWYQRALAYADDPILRSRICNNWAFTEDSLRNKDKALKLWLRALTLDPSNYVPRFNIFCEDSMAHNMTACKHHMDEFGKLLAKDKLSQEDKSDLLESLDTEAELDWVRSIKTFRRTISSWQSRYGSKSNFIAASHPIATLVAITILLLLLCGSISKQRKQDDSHQVSQQNVVQQQVIAKKKQKKGKKKQRTVA